MTLPDSEEDTQVVEREELCMQLSKVEDWNLRVDHPGFSH